MREIERRSGSWFDPEIVTAALSCDRDTTFWDELAAPDLENRVFAMQPALDKITLNDARLDEIIEAFARVIDAKSPFTHGHSQRVALYTGFLSQELNFGKNTQRWMRRTALMHDIGKLGVSNQILDKNGKLTADEFEIIKRHPLMSESILSRVPAFQPMAWIAAMHHERLDGKGYPYGRTASSLIQEMRVLTVADIFDALSADRPYRSAMSLKEVRLVMNKMVGTAIDGDIVDALWHVVERTELPGLGG